MPTYPPVLNDVSRLYEKSQFQGAIGMLDRSLRALGPEDGDARFDLLCWKAMMLTELKDYATCFDILWGLVDEGYVCPLSFNRYRPLENDPRYTEMDRKNEENRAAAEARSEMIYSVHLPEGYGDGKKYPMFLILHGDGFDGTILDLKEEWKPEHVTVHGVIAVYVQSSKVLLHRRYGWMRDPVAARRDVRVCYDDVVSKLDVDLDRVIVGGFSGGAIASVDIAMAAAVPMRGFIALSPSVMPSSVTEDNAARAARKGIRGVMFEGEKELPVAAEDQMLEVFRSAGLACRYDVQEGGGHDIPPQLEVKLGHAISYVLGSD